jgi:hypothetical protein
LNALIMPVTVPNRPIRGAIFEIVCRIRIPFSSFATSRAAVSSMARMTSSRPRRCPRNPAEMMFATGPDAPWQCWCASSSALRARNPWMTPMKSSASSLALRR